MVFDSLDKIQWTAGSGIALVTAGDKSAATLSGTTAVVSDDFAIPGGTGFTQPMYLNVFFSAAAVGSSTGTSQFDVEANDAASGGSWYLLTSGNKNQIALTTTPQAGQFSLPVVTQTAKRLRLKTTNTGSSPAVSASADLNIAQL